VIVLAVRWCLCFGLFYRDVEEKLAARGNDVDHLAVHRWVQRFTSATESTSTGDSDEAVRARRNAASASADNPAC
jgi:transposase-like protein